MLTVDLQHCTVARATVAARACKEPARAPVHCCHAGSGFHVDHTSSTDFHAAQQRRYPPPTPLAPTHACVTPGSQGMVSGRMAPAGSVLSVRKNRTLRPLGSSVVSIWGHRGEVR